MLTPFTQVSGQPPLPPPSPPFPWEYPPGIPNEPFPFDTPAPPPPPLHYRTGSIMKPDGEYVQQGIQTMPDTTKPDREKPPTPEEQHEDEGRDEALDESFPASDPPAQGRTTGPDK